MTNPLNRGSPLLHRIGVEPIINCTGVRAINGNSRLTKSVRTAMDEASRVFVNMDELQRAAGRYTAEMIAAENALITSGSAASLTLAVAACVAGNDPHRILKLPLSDPDRRLVLVPADQRFSYEHSLRLAGCNIEFPRDKQELLCQLGKKPCMICALARRSEDSVLSIRRLKVLTGGQIPILVDAAGFCPTHPDPWLAKGADLVAYSLGKFVGGPAASGLLAGRRDLVEAASAIAAPHQGFGRGFKIGKEQIAGAVAALEEWFRDGCCAKLPTMLERRLNLISNRLACEAGISVSIARAPGNVAPRLRISWDPAKIPTTVSELRNRLLKRTPRIMIDDPRRLPYEVSIDPTCLRDDEADAVAIGVLEELKSAVLRIGVQERNEVKSLEGLWRYRIDYPMHAREGTIIIPNGRLLSEATVNIDGQEVIAKASIDNNKLRISCETAHDEWTIYYRFEGTVTPKGIRGRVSGGMARREHDSSAFREQFGTAPWSASRENSSYLSTGEVGAMSVAGNFRGATI
ncbi:hypothetical protein CCGE525_37125 (plasmid) [Rhizobium jaguaris]|uniref:Aminotransferase class V-fold PLP-dependent enzyme n=2 Tax=Rhizobium jaguaris TaxID=1312183 RepID=A0A387G4V8_9HYPH|nr:hypothetical protein CCGE525_37125 [Rhizobium jaguaris]